jgi:hypothetical protein
VPTSDDNTRLQIDQLFDALLVSVTRVQQLVAGQKHSFPTLCLEDAYYESVLSDTKKIKCKACGYRGHLAWLGKKDAFIGCARCGSVNWEVSLSTTP